MLMFLVANSRLDTGNNLIFALALGTASSPVRRSSLKPKPAETKLPFHEHNWISYTHSITHFLTRLSPKMVTTASSHVEHHSTTAANPPPMAAVIHCAFNGTTVNIALLKTVACRINW
jgi:hypothetical protein